VVEYGGAEAESREKSSMSISKNKKLKSIVLFSEKLLKIFKLFEALKLTADIFPKDFRKILTKFWSTHPIPTILWSIGCVSFFSHIFRLVKK